MVKRIMVALSGTPYTHAAIQHAVELAQRHEARVTGIAILDRQAARPREPVPIGGAEFRARATERSIEEVRERIELAVSEFENSARTGGIDYRIIRDAGDPVETLCSAWRYQDLTLVGLRGLFDYGVLHEPQDALIRLITSGMRPVLAVSSEYRPVRKVLVAYSGSLESAKAMKRFMHLRLWPEATVHLVNFTGEDHVESGYPQLLGDSAAYCLDWQVELEAHARSGNAKEHLLAYADEIDADLVVMGDSAKSLLTRKVFGDTALHVIRTADRPLFLSH